jgi:peptide/nickel transport system permease protein
LFHSKDEISNKQLKGFSLVEKKLGLKFPTVNHIKAKRGWQHPDAGLTGTLIPAIAAMIIAVAFGIPLGVIAAVKKNTCDTSAIFPVLLVSRRHHFHGDHYCLLVRFLLSDWTGLHISGSWLKIDDVTGEKRLSLQNLWLPLLPCIRPLAIITQLTRAMLDTRTRIIFVQPMRRD